MESGLRVVGLFAGVGGWELGLKRAGHRAVLLSEISPDAVEVLRVRFPSVRTCGDVRDLRRLPACDVVAAGFPCQDLSQCGLTQGMDGRHSSLVSEVFRLLRASRSKPEWVLLENVPFMLRLQKGRAMAQITGELEKLGYRWAYRTIDARTFGVPQRRLRVVLVAARTQAPAGVLFADDAPRAAATEGSGFGFYWTEGNSGLGWGVDCVPTLKSGSGLGIPSPPAIWNPSDRTIGTIDIRDAERLQGFPVNWTKPSEKVDSRVGTRWRLIGNAVCVPVATWVGKRLLKPGKATCELRRRSTADADWPSAACSDGGELRIADLSPWPSIRKAVPILEFLKHSLKPLSKRAAAGFLSRALRSSLRISPGLLADVKRHVEAMV